MMGWMGEWVLAVLWMIVLVTSIAGLVWTIALCWVAIKLVVEYIREF